MAAQLFRADLFARVGLTPYDTAWFAGHHVPAYSVLFPPLGAWLGVRVVGALAAVAAAAAFGALAGRRAGLLAVPALLAALVSARITFLLGAAFGLAAVWAAANQRRALTPVLGVLTALASPVAALFAGLAGVALRSGPGVALGVAVAVPTAALGLLFPTGGTFPYVVSAFLPPFLGAVAVTVAAPRRSPLQAGAALYALLCLAAFVVPTPVGGNASRLGMLVAVPVAVHLLWPHRKVALAVLAVPLAYWVLQPTVRELVQMHDDPTTDAAFFAPVVERYGGRPVRIEIPMLRSHFEAFHVARHVSLARGWERQLDRRLGPLFYDGFTAVRYERWLRDTAVSVVALPRGVAFDGAGRAEAELVASAPPFLRELDGTPRWRFFAVRDPTPLAGHATVTRLAPDAVTLTRQRGRSLVRLHHSRWLRPGCAIARSGPWITTTSPRITAGLAGGDCP